MRSFYLSFPIWNAVRSELGWTHYRSLPEDVKLRATKLESAIISHLKDVLMELGRGFSFVARQKHMRSGTGDIIERCRVRGLPAPVWENEDDGCVVTIRRALPRTTQESSSQSSPQSSPQMSLEMSPQNISEGAVRVMRMIKEDD